MSASYYFKCNKCQEIGGQYTRQAWGWGNFYVINTFKFLAFHTENCGHRHLSIVNEDEVDADVFNPKNDLDFLQKTKEYFPAFETQLNEKNISEFDREELKEQWYREKLENAQRWYGKSFPDKEDL